MYDVRMHILEVDCLKWTSYAYNVVHISRAMRNESTRHDRFVLSVFHTHAQHAASFRKSEVG